jgi:predicted NUDIX family phosphoesterase
MWKMYEDVELRCSMCCVSMRNAAPRLLAMINESNVQKTRYEMEDDPNVAQLTSYVFIESPQMTLKRSETPLTL